MPIDAFEIKGGPEIGGMISTIAGFRFIEVGNPHRPPAVELGRDIVADIKREMQMACKKKGKGRGK